MYRILLLSVFSILLGCSEAPSQKEAPKQKIAEKVDATKFAENLATLKDIQLIDVRTPEEFAAGAIENAVNIDFYGDNFSSQLGTLDKSKPIMVYCQAGVPEGRSGQTMDKLKEMGFQEIYELVGGYAGWIK